MSIFPMFVRFVKTNTTGVFLSQKEVDEAFRTQNYFLPIYFNPYK